MLTSHRAFVGIALSLGLNMVAGCFLFQYYQPLCEPCLPGTPCPACVSTEQYLVIGIAGVIALLLLGQLVGLIRRR
jgi:hypothetical protein